MNWSMLLNYLFQKYVTFWKSHVNMDFIVWQIFNQTPQSFNKCMINWFVYFLAVLNARKNRWLCISLWEVPREGRILYGSCTNLFMEFISKVIKGQLNPQNNIFWGLLILFSRVLTLEKNQLCYSGWDVL